MNTYKIIPFFLLAGLCIGLWSCIEDKGNYDYIDMDQVLITGMPEGTQVMKQSEKLTIIPKLEFVNSRSESDYTYEWLYVKGNSVIGSTFPLEGVIATTRNLENYLLAGLPADNYTIYYTVSNSKTGRIWQTYFPLTIQTAISEGFLVMNDINGKMRLDMLSYTPNAIAGQLGTFLQLPDVLSMVNSGLPEQSGPEMITGSMDNNAPLGGYSLWVLSATGSTQLDPATFNTIPTSDISFRMGNPVPAGFKARRIYYTGNSAAIMVDWDYNVYHYLRSMNIIWGSKLNTINQGASYFKVNPQIADIGIGAGYIMFNDDNQKFYRMDYFTGVLSTMNDPNLFSFPGMELMSLKHNYFGNCWALLKDPATNRCRLIRFTYDATTLDIDQELTEANAPGITTATFICPCPEEEKITHVNYSSGGKVYQYDTALKTTKLMLDFGANTTVTYMDIPKNIIPTTKYAALRYRLIVGTHNSSTNVGTMSLYDVPTVNGQLVKTSMDWTGFGKIVSVFYRTR